MSKVLSRAVLSAALFTSLPAVHAATYYVHDQRFTQQSAGRYTLNDLKADFGINNVSYSLGLAPDENTDGNAKINDYGGNKVLQIRYRPGAYSSGSGVLASLKLPPRDEYYLSYRFKFQNSSGQPFDWKKGGKLPGLAGGTAPTGGNYSPDGFSSRYMWKTGGGLMVYFYWLNQTSRTNSPGSQYGQGITLTNFTAQSETQFVIRQRVKLNSPGNADGVLQVWVNDYLYVNWTNLTYRESGDTWQIDRFLLHSFYGGGDASHAPDTNNYAIIDDVKIYYNE